ncbi:MAG: GNAT family N-acetyltransferase [Alphaproteobacteria bacterium]|nr:GNAT family N-acetyltransferase [Alphaproteobacteria bacterium]
MKIININGPINSGKTTISKLLQEKLPQSLFIEVDDLLSDDEQENLKLSREQGWAERLQRLDKIIVQEKNLRRYDNIIFAYPMTDKTYHQWKLWEDKNTKFINITLAPNMDVCLQNRGTRELSETEKTRIEQMYQEGYHCSNFADFIINNTQQTPQETLQKILDFLCLNIRRANSDDAYDIKKIHIETYQKSYKSYLPDEYLDHMPFDDEVIERTKKYLKETECWLAAYENKSVAFVYVSYPAEDTFEINALYVHPQYQKCGAGSLLVNHLCKTKKAKGFLRCIVWTMKSGPSLPFYEKLNFKKTEEEKLWKFNLPIIKLVRNL